MLRCNVSRGIHRRMKTVGRYDPCDFWPPPCVPAWTALDSFRGQNTDFTIYFIISSISMLASLQLSSHSYTPTKSCTCFLLPMCITQAVLHAPRLKGMYGTLERSKTSRRTKCSGSGSEGNSRVPRVLDVFPRILFELGIGVRYLCMRREEKERGIHHR